MRTQEEAYNNIIRSYMLDGATHGQAIIIAMDMIREILEREIKKIENRPQSIDDDAPHS